MVKAALFGAGLVVGLAGGALAQQQQPAPAPFPNMMQGTPEEQRACAPDSARFCKQFEPDAFQVLGCLQQNLVRVEFGSNDFFITSPEPATALLLLVGCGLQLCRRQRHPGFRGGTYRGRP